jgi:hypothetical protein
VVPLIQAAHRQPVGKDNLMETVSLPRMGVRALLGALLDGWQTYPAAVRDLSDEDRAAYLDAQGYERLRDLLAHAIVRCEETIGVVSLMVGGGAIQRDCRHLPGHDPQALARFQYLADAEVLRRFALAYSALGRMLAFLPDTVLEDPEIFRWLNTTIVEDYNTHRPPNRRAVPSGAGTQAGAQ